MALIEKFWEWLCWKVPDVCEASKEGLFIFHLKEIFDEYLYEIKELRRALWH